MPRLPRLSGRDAIRALERLGFTQVRQRGSHIVLQPGSATCVVRKHRELKLGMLSGILDQAEVSVEELLGAIK